MDDPALVQTLSIKQCSFRKTGTMGTLVTKAEIAVWVQVPSALAVLEVGAGGGCPLPQQGPAVVRTIMY